jgi:hypothetical protein
MTKKKSIRVGHRGAVRKLITKLQEELENSSDQEMLEALCNSLKRKQDILSQLDTEILEETPEENMEAEIEDSDRYAIDIGYILAKVQNFSKKRKFPAITSSFASQPVTQHESHPVERSPALVAHTTNTPQVKWVKQQTPPHSNSIEQKGLNTMPGKTQRTLESSHLVSQGSVSNDNEFEGDIKSDVTDSIEIQSKREQNEVSEKSELKPDKEDNNRNLMDYSKIVDKKTDMLAVEQDLQNQAAEIEKVNEQLEEEENKVAEVKIDVKGKEERTDKQEDLAVKSPPQRDDIEKSQLLRAKDLEIPTTQAVDEHITVIPSSGNREKHEKAENEVEKKPRRREKVQNKTVEKREQAKEKRRGRSPLTSIAKKRAAGQVSAKLQKDSKPLNKNVVDKHPKPSSKSEDLILKHAKHDEQIPKEENKFEKKKEKKKMKRKLEVSSETISKKKAMYRSREAQQSRIDSQTIRDSTIRVANIVQIQGESNNIVIV